MMSETRVVYFTGTKTRRAFEQAIAGATVPFTIAYLDLDDFKATNGGGYDKGDAILKAVAAALVRQTRATDTVARVGGDEFAILLSGAGSNDAHAVLERIHRAIREHVACSIGAVTFERIPEGTINLVDGARGLMQMVKYSGKNQIKHETIR
jgi:diguanylate cyclase (GGDEF)-like protein